MSGGALFDSTYPNFGLAGGKWEDDELNELYYDLFIGGEFAVRHYGGLCQSLDFYLSDDICEEGYLRKLARFKAKWFGREPEGGNHERVENAKTPAYRPCCPKPCTPSCWYEGVDDAD